eukprot:3600251-Rhodomonas_salina.1
MSLDDADEDGDTEILSTGAIVCKAHKLEVALRMLHAIVQLHNHTDVSTQVCGACQLDFRCLNKEMGKTVPPPEKPVVTKKEVKAAAKFGKGDVDPSSLEVWSHDEGKLEKTFLNCFSVQEKLRNQVGDRPTDDVNYDMRVASLANSL